MRRAALGATAAMLCLLAGCSADSEPSGQPTDRASTAVPRTGSATGTTDQVTVRDSAVADLSARASGAAELVASGDGLRVENRTGADVALVFPDGMTAWVKPDRYLVAHMPCAERLPVRAETGAGAVLEVYDEPCRRQDTWVID